MAKKPRKPSKQPKPVTARRAMKTMGRYGVRGDLAHGAVLELSRLNRLPTEKEIAARIRRLSRDLVAAPEAIAKAILAE